MIEPGFIEGQWRISLDAETRLRCEAAAQKRHDGHAARGTFQKYGRDQSERSIDLELDSLGAEFAGAEFIGVEWIDTDNPALDREQGDLGNGVQVRQTEYPHGRLLLHDDDDDAHAFMLMTGRYPNYVLVGWITGGEGKAVAGPQIELQPGRPCYVVGQRHLHRAARPDALIVD